ncbi:hypothetical protein BH09VER1_BH09VER1_48320 [soil metagenome]
MRLNLHPARILILALCLGAFVYWGGFVPPVIAVGAFQASRMHQIWLYSTIIFVVGAFCASVIDHRVGREKNVNLRPAYLVVGILLMAASAYWLYDLRQSLTSLPMNPRDTLCQSSVRSESPAYQR